MTSICWADPIYKCSSNGKVLYSNEPCVGAERIDATPSKGFDKSSGKSLKGAAVQQEEMDQMLERSAQVMLGKQWKLNTAKKRQFHNSQDKLRCEQLDADIENLEKQEQANRANSQLPAIQSNLYQKRKTYRDLDC